MVEGELRDLAEAVNRIQRLSDDHWRVLDASCRLLEDNAWVGPTARRFGEEMYEQRKELRVHLAEAVQSVKDALQEAQRSARRT